MITLAAPRAAVNLEVGIPVSSDIDRSGFAPSVSIVADEQTDPAAMPQDDDGYRPSAVEEVEAASLLYTYGDGDFLGEEEMAFEALTLTDWTLRLEAAYEAAAEAERIADCPLF